MNKIIRDVSRLIDEIQRAQEMSDGGLPPEHIVDLAIWLNEEHSDKLPNRMRRLIGMMDSSISYGEMEPVGNYRELLNRFYEFCIYWVNSSIANTSEEEASTQLLPIFELDEDDRARVMGLCEQMRKIIFASPMFDDPHKQRLLNRVAAIEKQVLSVKGLYDVVLGGMDDFGQALGKFGKDVKPLVDRMKEIRSITRKSTEDYKQLPEQEELKRLPKPEDEIPSDE